MTFASFENSKHNGRPVELFEFRYGDTPGDVLTFTGADETIVVAGSEYIPLSIEYDGFSEDGNPDDGESITLEMPRNNPLADLYRFSPPEKTVTVKIKRVHRNDPDEQVLTVWSGRVIGASWEFPTMRVSCERMSTSLQRTGLRARYQRQCRHVHYGDDCGLLKDDFRVETTVVDVVDQLKVVSPDALLVESGYFNGGILEFEGTMRLIVWHQGDTVKMSRPINGLSVDSIIRLYPGCDRLPATCRDKFSNIENYGGFDFIPGIGPFQGRSVI